MIIDSHVHVGKDNFPIAPLRLGIDELIAGMDNEGIDKAIIFPFPVPKFVVGNDRYWYFKENEELLRHRKEYPDRIYIAAGANFSDKMCIEHVNRMAMDGDICAVKFHSRAAGYGPEEINSEHLGVISELNIPLILHVGSGYEKEFIERGKSISITGAITFAKGNPNIRKIKFPLGMLHKRLYEALDLPNVAVDTSAISWYDEDKSEILAKEHLEHLPHKASEIIEMLLVKGYEEKVLFGSDNPYGVSYKKELSLVMESNIKQEQLQKLLCENALNWFSLK